MSIYICNIEWKVLYSIPRRGEGGWGPDRAQYAFIHWIGAVGICCVHIQYSEVGSGSSLAGAAAGWQVGCRFRLGCCTVWQEGGTGPEPGGGGEGGDLHNVRYTHGSS